MQAVRTIYMNDLEDLSRQLQEDPYKVDIGQKPIIQQPSASLSTENATNNALDELMQSYLLKLDQLGASFQVFERFKKIADIIGKPIIETAPTNNNSESFPSVQWQLILPYRTWNGKPLIQVVDNVTFPSSSGMTSGGGVSSHEETGKLQTLSNRLLMTLSFGGAQGYESFYVNFIHSHWYDVSKFDNYKRFRNTFKLYEESIENVRYHEDSTVSALSDSDPVQFGAKLNEAIIKLYRSYQKQIKKPFSI